MNIVTLLLVFVVVAFGVLLYRGTKSGTKNEEPAQDSLAQNPYASVVIGVVVAYWGIPFILTGERGMLIWILDIFTTWIHESGHVVFAPFGEVLLVAGGTLFQIIIPAAAAVYALYLRREVIMAWVCIFWLGTGLVHCATYIRDARAQVLPKFMDINKDLGHDWNYLLGQTGLLNYDQVIGGFVHVIAVILIVISIIGLLLPPAIFGLVVERFAGNSGR